MDPAPGLAQRDGIPMSVLQQQDQIMTGECWTRRRYSVGLGVLPMFATLP
jgi:hypothetical protein